MARMRSTKQKRLDRDKKERNQETANLARLPVPSLQVVRTVRSTVAEIFAVRSGFPLGRRL